MAIKMNNFLGRDKEETVNYNDSALIILSDIIENTGRSLFAALKHLYAISDEDFYNISAKDIFKVSLSDVTNPDLIQNLGIKLDKEKLGEMHSVEFTRVENLIYYSLVIRLPFVKRNLEYCPLKDSQMRDLYEMAAKRGALNYNDIIENDMDTMIKMAKNRQAEPVFDGEWFRRWVYTCGKDLAAINNRNMFLFGCIDALFPLYYSALTEKLNATFSKWKNKKA